MGVPKANVMGIYEIRCNKNNMIYVGKSKYIGLRWSSHISLLISGEHPNTKLQDDYNKFGINSFQFSVLEICFDDVALNDSEKRWINKYDESMLYNELLYNDLNPGPAKVQEFIDYINKKWLLSSSEDDNNSPRKRIWRDEDKYEIRKRFWDCRVINYPFSYLTFNRVIKTMERDLGYTILSSRRRINKELVTYKLITSFNPSKIKYRSDEDVCNELGCTDNAI